jgi:2-C-methyl-D-erythritol 2,4-cyclodiphosphate synthase
VVAQKIRDNNFSISNVDSVIVAQRPKLASFIPAMRENIASDLGVDIGAVNVKATTPKV